MGTAVQRLPVMKYTPNQDPAHQLDPASMHSLGYTLMVSALLLLGTFALMLALSYPITAAGVIALAGLSWYAVRTFRHFYRTRRRAGWTRTVCVPKLGVCIEL